MITYRLHKGACMYMYEVRVRTINYAERPTSFHPERNYADACGFQQSLIMNIPLW